MPAKDLYLGVDAGSSVCKAALFDQRAIDVAIINSSLWAPGFERESLLGRKPHRLDADRIAKMKAFMADGMARLHARIWQEPQYHAWREASDRLRGG